MLFFVINKHKQLTNDFFNKNEISDLTALLVYYHLTISKVVVNLCNNYVLL